ncbi:MAG: hypothetical protein AB1428_12330 [Bacteroidota bacterium]
MKLQEVIDILGAQTLVNGVDADVVVESACGADLMSDVLTYAKAGALLLTGLTTVQVIYTAEMADIRAICFVRGKKPPEETVSLAQSKKITLVKTSLPMFESCGKLYRHGLKGCSET